MAKTDLIRRDIKSKIEAIKKINDNPKLLNTNITDGFKDDLSSTAGVVTKNINSFLSKTKGGTQNKKDIFGEVIDITDSFLGLDKKDTGKNNSNQNPIVKRKILSYAKESARIAIQSSKQILTDEVRKGFFEGQGSMCSANTTTGTDPLMLSPKSFDFMNVLKVDPTSVSGKLIYENSTNTDKIKFNQELFKNFDSGLPYTFQKGDGTSLFQIQWDPTSQKYNVQMSSNGKITDFITDYYNTIEYPDLNGIIQTAMLMTIQGDGSEPSSFNIGMNNINRLCTKLFCLCGKKSTNDSPLLNNTPQQLTEDEYDDQNYFDFNDIEGIDLDDEDAQARRVLKFRDCNNFEIPSNSNHIEDFSYLLDKKTLDENINNTINKVANDAYEQAGETIPLQNLQISLNSAYIMKIPKAIISNVLSPKMFFPIAVSYQKVKNSNISAIDMMKNLYKTFKNVITNVFWKFIQSFWGFIKKDLLSFIKVTAEKILLDQLKKLKSIILSLINILKHVLSTGIQSCEDIFGAILQTISLALNKSVKIPVPGLLLALAEMQPGFSADRAYMDAMQRMEAVGINTGPIYGTENKLPTIVKSIIDSYSNEMDTNAYVQTTLKTTIIPANGTNAYIVEGAVKTIGKIF